MRILLATDGSSGALQAEEFLRALPISCSDDLVIAAAAHESEADLVDHLSWCRWRFSERDIRARTAIRFGNAVDVIEAVALEHGCDLVVTGSRGRGEWTGALLGSVARSLARDSVLPILVVRSRRTTVHKVLLVIDGSTEARAAVDLIDRMPLPASASITLVRVASMGGASEDELTIERARALVGRDMPDYDLILADDVPSVITRRASDADADLVVLGIADQNKASGPFPFSLVDHVLANAHCAVLVAKPSFATRRVLATADLSLSSA